MFARDTPQSENADTARQAQTLRVSRLQIAGFSILGLLTLGFSVWRAGWHNVFTPGWWHW